MKVAIINDVHFGVRNNSDVFIEYQKRFYSEILFPYLEKHKIKNIWILGDFYDNRKVINFKSQNTVRKIFLEPVVEKGLHLTVIPGNHDLFYNNTSQICSLKELLGYFTENVSILMNPTEIQYTPETRVLWLPWINSENKQESFEAIEKSKADVVLSHLELANFDVYKGIPAHAGMESSIFSKFKMVLTGHYHTKSHRDNIYYLGSQMQFTWGDCDDPKYFHVLDLKTHKLTAVKNPIEIYKKIKYNAHTKFTGKEDYKNKFIKIIIEEKKNAYEFDRFVEQLEQSECLDIAITDATIYGNFENSSVELLNEQDVQTASEDILSFMSEYIDNVDETSLDRSRLKTIMNSIFREAELLGVN